MAVSTPFHLRLADRYPPNRNATARRALQRADIFLSIDAIRGCAAGSRVLCGPSYAATHVPLALVVTQRRQAFWQSYGRWFVRPFRQLTPVASIRWASSQRRPGAMT